MNFTNPGREKELISSNVHLFLILVSSFYNHCIHSSWGNVFNQFQYDLKSRIYYHRPSFYYLCSIYPFGVIRKRHSQIHKRGVKKKWTHADKSGSPHLVQNLSIYVLDNDVKFTQNSYALWELL